VLLTKHLLSLQFDILIEQVVTGIGQAPLATLSLPLQVKQAPAPLQVLQLLVDKQQVVLI